MGDTVSLLYKLIIDNPSISTVIATALVAVIAFFKPIAAAIQKALIRRIDQAWPNDDSEYESKVQHTVDAVSQSLRPVPRSTVERAVRKHKSNPPPGKPQ